MIQQKQAFTLIELLVVILIIGILAAVAFPQYRIAVIKSQFTGLLPFVKTLQQAEEIYYLANGRYTGWFQNLDINLPGDVQVFDVDKSYAKVGKNLRLDLFQNSGNEFYDNTDESADAMVSVEYGDGENWIIYQQYLNHSLYPNQISCYVGKGELGHRICQSLGGVLRKNTTNIYDLK